MTPGKLWSPGAHHPPSSNGTYVNGKQIGKGNKTMIKNGNELSLVVKTSSEARRLQRSGATGMPFIAYIFQDPNAEASETQSGDLDEPMTRRYWFQETLGTGNFAAVKLAVAKETGQQFAVKLIDKRKFRMSQSLRPEQLMDEVRVLQDVHHANIIGIEEVFDGNRYLYIVLELVTGGDLFDRIVGREDPKGRYPEDEARSVMKQLGSAIQYLHRRNIAHRDLKPENILLVSADSHTHCKLSDFGLAKVIGEQAVMTTLCGTPGYLAPEVLRSQGKHAYTLAVDLWSLGVVMYVLLSGYPPFYEKARPTIHEQITQGLYDLDMVPWPSITADAKDLVRQLLTVDPAKRIDIERMMSHPWLSDVRDPPPKLNVVAPPIERLETEASLSARKKRRV